MPCTLLTRTVNLVSTILCLQLSDWTYACKFHCCYDDLTVFNTSIFGWTCKWLLGSCRVFAHRKYRVNQCRWFSQTCSMNMSGKFISWFWGPIKRFIFPRHVHWTCLGKFLTSWGPRRGVHFPDMFIKFEKIYPQRGKALSSQSGLVDCLSNFIYRPSPQPQIRPKSEVEITAR